MACYDFVVESSLLLAYSPVLLHPRANVSSDGDDVVGLFDELVEVEGLDVDRVAQDESRRLV